MSGESECPLRVSWPNRGADQVPRVVLSYHLDSGYLTSTDAFTLDVYDEKPERLRDLCWEPVELAVDGCPQLIGRIGKSERGRNGPGQVQLPGLDYLGDLVEGHVDPLLKITKDMTIAAAFKLAASPYGITSVVGPEDILMRNVLTGVEVKTRKAKKSLEAYKLEELNPKADASGQGCYDLLNRIAGHQGFTIQPSTKRSELRLSEPNYDQAASYKAWRTATTGNIKDGWVTEDGSKTPTLVICTGEMGEAGKATKNGSLELGLNEVSAFRPLSEAAALCKRRIPGKCEPIEFGKLYRLLYYQNKDAKNAAQLGRGMWRILGERIKDLLVYNCTLIGHRDVKTGAIYSVDTVIQVDDDWADVHEPLWIARRTFRWSSGNDLTDLECWRLGAFQF